MRKKTIGQRTATLAAILCVGGAALNAQATKPQTAVQAFKNIQANSLKNIPVDDFMGTMGIMTDALGFDCSECHKGAGTQFADWGFDTPRKIIARKMTDMVEKINKENFGGRQMVTCWTCHHGRDKPTTTIQFDILYGGPLAEADDYVPALKNQPAAATIFDKFIQATGGAANWAKITSYVAKGKERDFGGFGGDAAATLYAQMPNKRTLFINYPNDPDRGDTTRTFDGTTGWVRTPLTVLGEYQLGGGELDGAKLDGALDFTPNIKNMLTNVRVGVPNAISDLPGPESQTGGKENEIIGKNRQVYVLQGSSPAKNLVTLYFDRTTNLLVRMIRYADSPIGRVPTYIDFGDYRDVKGGVKFPHKMIFAWMDGRSQITFDSFEPNVSIPAERFGRPPKTKSSQYGGFKEK